jgi:hypothetical protein
MAHQKQLISPDRFESDITRLTLSLNLGVDAKSKPVDDAKSSPKSDAKSNSWFDRGEEQMRLIIM